MSRIYAVTNVTSGVRRLVRAPNQAQARNHCARDQLIVAVADAETAFDAARAGVEIEVAGEVISDAAED